MDLKAALDRLFDKDLDLTYEQRHILIGINWRQLLPTIQGTYLTQDLKLQKT